jgi:hypothetical protein
LTFRKNAGTFEKVRFGWNRSSFGFMGDDFRNAYLRLALESGFIEMKPGKKVLKGKGATRKRRF